MLKMINTVIDANFFFICLLFFLEILMSRKVFLYENFDLSRTQPTI